MADEDLLYGDLYGEETSFSGNGAQGSYGGYDNASSSGPAPIQSFVTNEDERAPPPRNRAYNDAYSTSVASAPRPIQSYSGGSSGYGQSSGYGGAAQANGPFLDGKMFIGGLNWETTEDSLVAYFSQYGTVTNANIMRDSTNGRSRGFAFLTFADPAAVNTVLAHQHFLDGKTVDPKRAVPPPNKIGPRVPDEPPTEKLFVRSIGPEITQEMFREYFSKFGPYTNCTLMMDRETGLNRGYGFVDYVNHEPVDAILASAPHHIHGQLVDCKKSLPKTRRDGLPGPPGAPGGPPPGNQGYSSAGFNQPAAPVVPPVPSAPAMSGPFDPQAIAAYFSRLTNGNARMLEGFDPAAMIKAINQTAASAPAPAAGRPPMPIQSQPQPQSHLRTINTFMSDTPPAEMPEIPSHLHRVAPPQQAQSSMGMHGNSPPPTGPAAMRNSGGPARTPRGGGGGGFHPYQR